MLLGLQTSWESGHLLKQIVALREAIILKAQSPVYLSGFLSGVCSFWRRHQLLRGICKQDSNVCTTFRLLTVSASLRGCPGCFMSRMSCIDSPCLPLFCQASGSKQLNWAALAPAYPQRAVTVLLYLATTAGFVNWLTNKATNPHYEQKQALTLKWWGHQKSGESDSWSSSWSGPLIRSEWQANMGPHRYLPPTLLLPYGH